MDEQILALLDAMIKKQFANIAEIKTLEDPDEDKRAGYEDAAAAIVDSLVIAGIIPEMEPEHRDAVVTLLTEVCVIA